LIDKNLEKLSTGLLSLMGLVLRLVLAISPKHQNRGYSVGSFWGLVPKTI
jgi:hypothetical protein